ncbi:MAG: DUF5606 domain-containing protein [Clostridiaceae bacterium]|nr:DUF5606 domain-containing protein [Clostridiaceae bacterium]
MKLKDILSISGKSGLYKFITQARNGIVVEAIEDGKRTTVPSSAKVSSLKDIAIFSEKDEIPLADILKKIYDKEGGKETISHKASPEELKAYMLEIMPDYDKERVYVSDMKKLVMWYNILLSHKMLNPDEKDEEETETDIKKTEAKEKSSPKEKKPGIKKARMQPAQNIKTTGAKMVPRTTKTKTGTD